MNKTVTALFLSPFLLWGAPKADGESEPESPPLSDDAFFDPSVTAPLVKSAERRPSKRKAPLSLEGVVFLTPDVWMFWLNGQRFSSRHRMLGVLADWGMHLVRVTPETVVLKEATSGRVITLLPTAGGRGGWVKRRSPAPENVAPTKSDPKKGASKRESVLGF